MSEELAGTGFVNEHPTRLEHSTNFPQSFFRFVDVVTRSEIDDEID